MSYDVEFFRLNEEVSLEEINLFLDSEDYENYLDELDEMDEESEELYPIPTYFIDVSIPQNTLESLIAKAYLQIVVPESERTEELNRYLESNGKVALPGEFEEEIDALFEWEGSPGMLPLCFSYTGDLEEALMVLAQMLEILQPHRIVMFDPQIGKVLDGTNARDLLAMSAEDARLIYEDIENEIESDELFYEDDEE